MQNKMIIDAEAIVDSKVPPADKEAYEKIVLAGKTVMFKDKDLHTKLMKGLRDAPEVKTLVSGIVNVVGILFKESRGTMPVVPMIFAGQSLMMEALDFAESANIMEVTPDTISEATQMYVETLLPEMGLSAEKMKSMMEESQGVMGDQDKMAQYEQSQQPAPTSAQPPTGLIGG